MNPLRHARVLAWTVVLLAAPQVLHAQDPCVVKKTYDDAKALADKADKALADFQSKNKLPPGKMPGGKASLDAELARTKADTVTDNQLVKDAEKALTDATTDSATFANGADKGKRLAELKRLIEAHQKKIDDIKKERDTKKATIKSIDDAKKAETTAADGIKKQMPSLSLNDVDDAKKNVDADVAQLEKAVQAQQTSASGMVNKMTNGGSVKAESNSIATTTGLQCPEVAAIQQVIARKGRALQVAVTNYENVDQNDAGAAGMRTEFTKKAKEIEDGIVADQATLLTAAQTCQQSVKNNLTDLDKKRNDLEKLDPGGTLRQQAEDLKKLEADKALETEKSRLTNEQTVANTQVSSARSNLTTSKATKAAADAAVEEVEKNIDAKFWTDSVAKVKPDYDAVVPRKDFELKRATDDLATAKTFLDDLALIKPKAAAFKTHKKEWDQRSEAWKKRYQVWQTSKDPAEAKLLKVDRDKLAADKATLDEEKGKLVTLLKDKKLYKVKMCDKKKELRDALANRKTDLDPFKCFTDVSTAIGAIDTRTKALAFLPARQESARSGFWRDVSVIASRRPGRLPPTLLEALECTLADLELETDLDELDADLIVDDFNDTIAEPTDSVPDDVAKNTAAVKVPRYYVFLLTNASNGLYVGDEDGLKQMVRCGFEGGGIGCKPTDLVTYKKLHGPFPTQEEAQAALCQSITETRYFPVGIGLKGRWEGSNTWYGLWDASVSGCPKR